MLYAVQIVKLPEADCDLGFWAIRIKLDLTFSHAGSHVNHQSVDPAVPVDPG